MKSCRSNNAQESNVLIFVVICGIFMENTTNEGCNMDNCTRCKCCEQKKTGMIREILHDGQWIQFNPCLNEDCEFSELSQLLVKVQKEICH